MAEKNKTSYPEKFLRITKQLRWNGLPDVLQIEIAAIAHQHRFTLQELRACINAARDFEMWQIEPAFGTWWQQTSEATNREGRAQKQWLFKALASVLTQHQESARQYTTGQQKPTPPQRIPLKMRAVTSEAKIYGSCPVFSPKTSCCNLRTIDVVKNCAMACSYCSIQTLYPEGEAQIDADFAKKLQKIEIDPTRRIHIGTGQSSDSLVWGNYQGVLEHLLNFAQQHPNVLLEFKTKSNLIKPLLKQQRPANIVCTWSLNPQVVIDFEEHFTASLEQRLQAAEALVASGGKVGFHLHPMIHCEGWETHYQAMIEQVIARFDSDSVAFVSFGALTFAKPVLAQIRERMEPTRILQMKMTQNPEGKLTEDKQTKQAMFDLAYKTFKPWHQKVFFYLCMETKDFWEATFGFSYTDNLAFEDDFLTQVSQKIPLITR